MRSPPLFSPAAAPAAAEAANSTTAPSRMASAFIRFGIEETAPARPPGHRRASDAGARALRPRPDSPPGARVPSVPDGTAGSPVEKKARELLSPPEAAARTRQPGNAAEAGSRAVPQVAQRRPSRS